MIEENNIRNIYNALGISNTIKCNHSENVSMLEEKFFRVFLPIFQGLPSPYNATISNWIAEAKGVNNPVDIYDADGIYVYTVPPLFHYEIIYPDINNTKTIPGSRLSIYQLIQVANNYSQIPGEGHRLLNNVLSSYMPRIQVEDKLYMSKLMEVAELWKIIFNRYNITYHISNTLDSAVPNPVMTHIYEQL